MSTVLCVSGTVPYFNGHQRVSSCRSETAAWGRRRPIVFRLASKQVKFFCLFVFFTFIIPANFLSVYINNIVDSYRSKPADADVFHVLIHVREH